MAARDHQTLKPQALPHAVDHNSKPDAHSTAFTLMSLGDVISGLRAESALLKEGCH